jgi:hypothetical protein
MPLSPLSFQKTIVEVLAGINICAPPMSKPCAKPTTSFKHAIEQGILIGELTRPPSINLVAILSGMKGWSTR